MANKIHCKFCDTIIIHNSKHKQKSYCKDFCRTEDVKINRKIRLEENKVILKKSIKCVINPKYLVRGLVSNNCSV